MPAGSAVASLVGFIELGVRDIAENTRMNMSIFEGGASFMSVNLADLIIYKSEVLEEIFHEAMVLIKRIQGCGHQHLKFSSCLISKRHFNYYNRAGILGKLSSMSIQILRFW